MVTRSAHGAEREASVGDHSPKLRGLDSNPEGAFGPRLWRTFRDSLTHLYAVSLPEPSQEARFTVSTRSYATPQGVLMRSEGTAFVMTRGPAQIARGADQLLVYLQCEGACDVNCAGRRGRIEAGDVVIIDYARPLKSTASDYANLLIVLPRQSLPATLLALDPHGLVFPRGGGAARLIGAALRELYAQADDLTVSEAEAAIEAIVALTTGCARARLEDDRTDHLNSRRRAALDYVDTHLGNAQLGPNDIARAIHVSRASLYRLLAAQGGVRAVVLTRRLHEALRLMLADSKGEHSLKEIARRCGFASASQFSRAFRARFGEPPGYYVVLVRQQGLEWHEARMVAEGFDRDALFWRKGR